jgi:3-deoxy-D-manno-octulosonic-acid transferase
MPNRYVINADSVEIRFMDNGIVDGDTISVFYNGQLIVPKLSLKEKPYIVKLPLYPDYPNRLLIHAESLGEFPPNTALVRIIYGKKEESFLLSSSMSKSGSIELMNNTGSTASTP